MRVPTDMPKRRKTIRGSLGGMSPAAAVAVIFLAIAVVAAISFAITALVAWVLMLVLSALGVGWGFWLCFGVVFLVNCALSVLRSVR